MTASTPAINSSRCSVPVELQVIAGPHRGQTFTFDHRESFLVGRTTECHLQMTGDDRFFSRKHFLIEANPPRCRVIDLGSRNGTFVNGERIRVRELKHGDEVRAGHTVFRVVVPNMPNSGVQTIAQVRMAPPTPTWSPPGYCTHEIVGEGTMGVVYRATRLIDHREVAIKVLKTNGPIRPKQRDRFQREALILSKLRHPNIVRSRESGLHENRLYLVMDWIHGNDAASLVSERGPLPIRKAVRIASQLLAALAVAHEAGFVHRDVKPANIMLDSRKQRRRAKLADFGLARAYERSRLAGITMTGEIGGTPAFMPPEQVSHYRDVGPAADQYSAAATLYTLLTGQPVYDLPANLGDQLVVIVTQAPIPIRARRSEIPEALAAIVMKALSHKPNDRYENVTAFQNALRPYAYLDE
jgi:eukaryotic-like serine/threonine-protein kinase